jgi:hypothetical protein
VSSRELLKQNYRLEPIVRTLLNDPPFDKRASSRQLGTSLGLWWVTVGRAANSGTAAWAAMERTFARPRQRPRKRDPLARWEAMLDYSSAFTVGAMVLEDLAYCEMERRSALPGGKRPSYWSAFVKHLDPRSDDPMRGAAIYLDLTLYEGRNVLVIHRRVGHWDMHAFGNDGAVYMARVVLPADRSPADDLIRRAAAAYPVPEPAGITMDALADRLIAVSARLPAGARDDLKAAYRLGGITPPPFPRLVERVTGLIEQHVALIRATRT